MSLVYAKRDIRVCVCVCFFLQEICRESYKTCVNFFQSFFGFLECSKIQQLWWVGGWVGGEGFALARVALGALFFFGGGGGAKFRHLATKKMAVRILCF